MKKAPLSVLMFALILCSLCIGACEDEKKEQGKSHVITKRKWTYLVYIAGDNDLAEAAYKDLLEIADVGSTDQVALVAQAEFSPRHTPDLPRSTYRFYFEKDARLAPISEIGNVDMGNWETLRNFLNWGKEKYPAENYYLVLWSHGDGWRRSRAALQDESSGSFMANRDIARGIRESMGKVSVVDFDACLMGTVETAFEFSSVCSYFVGSQELVPGDGYPYDKVLRALVNSPEISAKNLAISHVDTYVDYYTRRESVTKSVIDCAQVEILSRNIGELGRSLARVNPRTIDQLAAAVQKYSDPNLKDLGHFASQLVSLNYSPSEAGKVVSALSHAVVYNRHFSGGQQNVRNSNGLSIFIPTSDSLGSLQENDHEKYFSSTFSSFDDGWSSLLRHLRNPSTEPNYGYGDFRYRLEWNDLYSDVDLYVADHQGNLFAPWMGAVCPIGFFSADSFDSGQSYELFRALSRLPVGTYSLVGNLYDGPPTLATGLVALSNNEVWSFGPYYLDFSNPKPPSEPVTNNRSDWVILAEITVTPASRSSSEIILLEFPDGASIPVEKALDKNPNKMER